MSSNQQIVLLVGATGHTGTSIARALVKRPEQFKLKALVRPSSLRKPIVQELKDAGADIVTGDLENPETIEEHLHHVNTLILTIIPAKPGVQDALLLAAKKAGVKRVVPSDFGPTAPEGVMLLQDNKLATQRFIRENNIPHTFIQVGWWASLLLPYPHSVNLNAALTKRFFGDGKVKVAYTVLDRIGEFVARIIADPRTLNKTVFTHDGEATLEEAYAIGSKASGENFDDYPRISKEEIQSWLEKSPSDIMELFISQYVNTLFVRGENTVEKAVERGALSARDLYPDYTPLPLDEYAQGFYSDYSKIGHAYDV